VSVAEKPVEAPAVVDGPARDDRVTTITPPTRLPRLDVRELWRFRELAAAFVLRDLKVRYKQTLIGVAWVLIQPLLATAIFTIFFGRYANLYSDGKPYQVFVFSGVIMWMTYFGPAFTNASGSIAGSKGLVTKVFFPRLLLPLGAVATPLVDFVVVFPVLVGMVLWLQIPITGQFLLFPFFVLLAVVTAFAAGLFFTAAGVRYRDVPYAIPFVMLVLLFCSPVFWSINDPDLQEKYVWLASLNPMTGAISGFRWAVIGSPAPPAPVLPLGIAMTVVLLVTGLAYFRRAEPGFADTI
jgi:homopolymeric O-antigen transport system permease protein